MDERIREYELLYIISATFTDEEMGSVEGRVKELLEKNSAAITSTDRLGKFRFAYPIKHQRYGNYVMVRFNSDTQGMARINDALRLSADVLRHIIIRTDEIGENKFDLVQFTEVNVDAKLDAREERQRRGREDSGDKTKAAADIKSGVAALESGKEEEVKEAKESAESDELSAEELEKKINTALKDEV